MTTSGDENRYQVTLHAENLPNHRWFGRSCPYAKVKVTTGPQKGTVIGQTEPATKELSPNWTAIMFLNFTDADVTNLEVTIFDYRGENQDVWMGEANFEATSIFQSPGRTQSQQIGRAENSKLFCHIEKSFQGPDRGQLHLHLRGEMLTYSWTELSGLVIYSCPHQCQFYLMQAWT
jgi:Ca2+-dependent lipid-binding protein